MDVLADLEARGFVKQCSGLDGLRGLLQKERVTFYIGFDPTAPSLHVGNAVQLMLMRRLQAAGHFAIALVGGGTARVGDPSGKTELRKMLSDEQIAANVAGVRKQIEHFISLDGENGTMVDNADWLLGLNYVSFLRDIGRHFSVNRMLAAEAYKQRLERGLSFIEFNYQLLQAYDFLSLSRTHGARLQLGGDDQWGNILAGSDLIRRCDAKEAFALTTPLITTASGVKMGKTAKGAIWLDPDRTSPFEFYQYWLNIDDRDVGKCLKLFTDLSLSEIAELEALQGADIRTAKAVLAHRFTARAHGATAADAAARGASAMVAGSASDDLPTVHLSGSAGDLLVVLLAESKLAKSRGEARRLVQGGAVRISGTKVADIDHRVATVPREGLVVRVGKKRAVRILPPQAC
jgi:tyrosyl-tRNA synthetase